MTVGDLTTLANAKAWLGIGVGETGSDAMLSRLITATSGSIREYCQRDTFLSKAYHEIRDGSGSAEMVLRNFPVTSVSSLSISGASIPAGTYLDSGAQTSGWFLAGGEDSPDFVRHLALKNYYFMQGKQNVVVDYVAGYKTTEDFDVPGSPYLYTVVGASGVWAGPAGLGVYNPVSGVPFTLVKSNPAQGQYSYGATPGTYQFNSTDANASLAVDYSYVPFSLEQICIDWVSEKFRKRGWIGMRSKSLGGQESTTFDTSGMPSYITAPLQQYVSVVIIK